MGMDADLYVKLDKVIRLVRKGEIHRILKIFYMHDGKDSCWKHTVCDYLERPKKPYFYKATGKEMYEAYQRRLEMEKDDVEWITEWLDEIFRIFEPGEILFINNFSESKIYWRTFRKGFISLYLVIRFIQEIATDNINQLIYRRWDGRGLEGSLKIQNEMEVDKYVINEISPEVKDIDLKYYRKRFREANGVMDKDVPSE